MKPDSIPTSAPPFGQLAFATNRFLLDHMRRIRQVFDLDLDIAFVFGSLAHLNVFHGLHPALPETEAITLKNSNDFRAVQLRDLVQVTGLPRETVRRYLLKLEQDERIFQPEKGKWCIRAEAITPHMIEDTVQTIQNLLKTANEVKEILERSGLEGHLTI